MLILLSFKYGKRITRLEIIVANPIPKTEPVLPNNFDNGHVKTSIQKRNEIFEMTFHFKNPVPRFILKGITELKEIILDRDNMSINNEKIGLISLKKKNPIVREDNITKFVEEKAKIYRV